MKKYLHIALMLLCVLVIPACGDDDKVDQEAVELEAYKLEQEVAFLEKADDPNYVKWESEAGDGYVLAKLIKKGSGKKAYFNSRVSVYYKGCFTNGKVFDEYQLEKTLMTTNYAIYGERDVILSYLEHTDLTSVFIEDITLY